MAERPSGSSIPGGMQLLQLGATWGALVGLGLLVGYALDRALGVGPLLVFVGLAVGIFSAAAGSYFLLKPYLHDAPEGPSQSKDAT